MAFSFLFWLLRVRTSGREWKLRFGTSQVVSAGQEAEVDEQCKKDSRGFPKIHARKNCTGFHT